MQRPPDAPQGLCPEAVGAAVVAGQGAACVEVLLHGAYLLDGQGLRPQPGVVETPAAAVGAAAVEAPVLHQRAAHVERQHPGQEERGVPAYGPRVVLALGLAAQHAGVAVGTVEVELTCQPPLRQLAQQGGAVGAEQPPGTLPRGPSPAARPAYEEGGGQRGVAGEVARLYVAHARLVGVGIEGIVHKAQEVGREHQVVLQHDDAPVLPDDVADAVDDVACQAVVLGAFHEAGRGEAARRHHLAHQAAHLADGLPLAVVARRVAIDVEGALGGLGVGQQAVQQAAGVAGAVVDEEQDGC